MKVDNHSVVYFINEEYGVVIRANGATREVAMWEAKSKGFTRRLDLLTASFLARTDRFRGQWCAAHATYRRTTAEKTAATLTPTLPDKDGMRLAKAAKYAAVVAELREKGSDRFIAEARERWNAREAQYAGL